MRNRAAYEAQALAEWDNPAERVMRQGEPFWWQRDNLILVPYNTTETRQQMAARMGIPVDFLEELDIARVWGRYRSANEYFDFGGNARLAHPIADYWSKR